MVEDTVQGTGAETDGSKMYRRSNASVLEGLCCEQPPFQGRKSDRPQIETRRLQAPYRLGQRWNSGDEEEEDSTSTFPQPIRSHRSPRGRTRSGKHRPTAS